MLCNNISFLLFFLIAVLNGYSCVPIALTEGLDIRLNTAVKKIRYYDGGVEVEAENLKTNNSSVIHKGKESVNWHKKIVNIRYNKNKTVKNALNVQSRAMEMRTMLK